jgi:thiol-disulfide isomerase/thioredoxin
MKSVKQVIKIWLLVVLTAASLSHAAGNEPMQLSGELVNDAPFDLERYRGKVVMVNFWATWCPTCRADYPSWQEVYEWYQGSDFAMVAVSVDRDPDALQRFLEKHDYTVPVLWRFGRHEKDTFPQIRGTPTTFFIGRDGKIASSRQGSIDLYEMTKTIDALLQP